MTKCTCEFHTPYSVIACGKASGILFVYFISFIWHKNHRLEGERRIEGSAYWKTRLMQGATSKLKYNFITKRKIFIYINFSGLATEADWGNESPTLLLNYSPGKKIIDL